VVCFRTHQCHFLCFTTCLMLLIPELFMLNSWLNLKVGTGIRIKVCNLLELYSFWAVFYNLLPQMQLPYNVLRQVIWLFKSSHMVHVWWMMALVNFNEGKGLGKTQVEVAFAWNFLLIT
jgi:hypothetical protein